jgi:GAF domain-containing protein
MAAGPDAAPLALAPTPRTARAVSEALSSTVDVYAVMRHLLRWTARTFNADVVGAYVLEHNGEWLSPIQGYHLPEREVGALRTLKLSVKRHAFYATAAAAGGSTLCANVPDNAGIPPTLLESVPHRAQLFVPFVANGRMVGCMLVAWLATAPPFQAGTLNDVESLAAQAGMIVQNARVLEAYFAQVNRTSSLWALVRQVRRELERSVIVQALEYPLGAGRAVDSIELYGGSTKTPRVELLFRMVNGVVDLELPRPMPLASAGLAAVVFRTGRPLRTRDVLAACRANGVAPSADNRQRLHWLGVPALAGEETLGVLAVGHRHFPFTATDEDALQHTVQRIALALRSAAIDEDGLDHHRIVAVENDRLSALVAYAETLRTQATERPLNQWLGIIEGVVTERANGAARA